MAVLETGEASAKALAARAMAADWRSGRLGWPGDALHVPDRPARPARPALLEPKKMPRRRVGSEAGRGALLHALAHIELNAIDLACDLIPRFGPGQDLPREFADDWVRVADEEGKHFLMLAARLDDFGMGYGDLPAHDGLWQAAEATAGDFAARLAVVPLVHEARGLDVTPQTVEALRRAGDDASAGVLEVIYRDEIGHVAAGVTWFRFAAERTGADPATLYAEKVATYHRGALKGPFNQAARAAAGLADLARDAVSRHAG